MARSPYSSAKRRRQLDKQKKKEEKKRRKELNADQPTDEHNPYLAMREETMEFAENMDNQDEDEEEDQ